MTERTTLCWLCNKAYEIGAHYCPRCMAANANLHPEHAAKQMKNSSRLTTTYYRNIDAGRQHD